MFQPLSQVLAIPNPGALPFGATSTRLQLRFVRPAWVVGLTLTCGQDDSQGKRSACELAISDGDQRAVLLDQYGEAFCPMSLLCPPDGAATPLGVSYPLPLVRHVKADETWSFTWRNFGSEAIGTISPLGALLLADDCSARPPPAVSRLPWCSRVLMVPGLTSVDEGETTPQCLIETPTAGRIVGMRAGAVGARRGALAVELFDPTTRGVLTTDIRAMAPISLPLLAPGPECTMPLAIPRKAFDKLSVRVQNLSSGDSYTPRVAFLYQDDTGWPAARRC